jgi:hypothetical protein
VLVDPAAQAAIHGKHPTQTHSECRLASIPGFRAERFYHLRQRPRGPRRDPEQQPLFNNSLVLGPIVVAGANLR